MKANNLPRLLNSKTPKIYKSKKLNKANFGNFTHSDYQIFLHLVSKIGGVDEFGKYLQPHQLEREHILTAKEFSEVFNTNIDNSYKVLRKAIDKLMTTNLKVERNQSLELWKINVCSMAKYNKKEGRIIIKFTDDIMPYLAQVRKKFVLYNLKEISNFGSLYTTRLYELIQEFKETGWILKSVEQLREIFTVGEKFKAYKDLKRHTFAHGCQEINNHYDMGLRFEEIKEGCKVVAVKFFFKKTLVHKVTNRKTGVEKNFYEKPALNLEGRKNKKIKQINSDILEGQLAFEDLKNEAQPVQNILSKILKKLTS
jgi:plasmid replication initiation protein